ncbi:MAG TPA: hypothetical protein VGG90_13945 [Candidatus Dormibacteraeota bacterium]
MTVGSSPPQGAPMLSPDGKWIWDGTRWLPIADPSTAANHAVFPAWNGVRVEAPVVVEAPVAPAPQPVPQRPRPVAAPPVYAAPVPQPMAVPLWRQQTKTGLNKYLYMAAGVIGLIVLAVVVNSLGLLNFGNHPAASTNHPASTGPFALTQRSDYSRADHFLNVVVGPAMVDLENKIETLRVTCVGQLTISCKDAIIETDNSDQALIGALNHQYLPLCIATPGAKVAPDATAIHTSLQLSQKGFVDGNIVEYRQGLARYATSVYALRADIAAATAAIPTCNTQLSGP